jgi:hypothetical protein
MERSKRKRSIHPLTTVCIALGLGLGLVASIHDALHRRLIIFMVIYGTGLMCLQCCDVIISVVAEFMVIYNTGLMCLQCCGVIISVVAEFMVIYNTGPMCLQCATRKVAPEIRKGNTLRGMPLE